MRRFDPGPVEWYHRAVLPPDSRVCQLIGRTGNCQVVRFPGTAIFGIDFRQEIEDKTDVPIIAEIAQVSTDGPIVIREGKRTAVAEQFRSLH